MRGNLTVRPSLSIFFPVYNDAKSIPGLIEAAFAVGSAGADDFEVIAVNDGSGDDSAAVLEGLIERLGPRLRIVTHQRNRGYGGALRSGFEAATKDLVFYTDGDAQYDVTELPLLLNSMTAGVGLVNGYKTSRSDAVYRVWIGLAYRTVVRFLFRIQIRDVDCDFRLVRRELVTRLNLTATSGAICVELVHKLEHACRGAGLGIVEVPVTHLPRQHGRSQFFRLGRLWATAADLARLFVELILPFRQ